MSFGGGRGGGGRKPLPPGSEFNWQKTPGELPDGAPTPLFPPYDTPTVVPLSNRERAEVDRYRALRDRFQNGPYYAVLNAASTSARQGTKERAQFDPFNGMLSYSSRYQRKKRTVPKLAGREYILHYFPRELWKVVRPDYKAEAPERHMLGSRWKRVQAQFEDVGDEDVESDDEDRKRRKTHDANGEDEEGPEDDGNDLDDREREASEEEDELRDDDFSEDDDEMGGDYNAEQYFDAGDDDGDGDGFADGGGGGGAGDEDFF